MCERVGGGVWPGTEAIERVADCQDHSGMEDRLGRKGQTGSCGQWELREVSRQGRDATLTWGAHMSAPECRKSLRVGCTPDLLSTGPHALVHSGVTWGLDAKADFQAHPHLTHKGGDS